MGIWIRSQDKTMLLNINGLSTGISSADACVFGRVENTDLLGMILGSYPTEAEAIQVLDMIQEYIAKGRGQMEDYGDGRTIVSDVVFQMPPAGFNQQPEKFIPGCGADLNHCELLDGTKAGVCEDYFECKAAWDRGCR